MVTIVEGDLLKANVDIIAHQVNCKGVMGAGLAEQVKKKYPEGYIKYRDLCGKIGDSSTYKLLGTCYIVPLNDGKYLANLFGQDSYGRNKMHTNYSALTSALITLKDIAKEKNLSIGLPYEIGCNNGGGDWMVVSRIIGQIFEDYAVTIVKYNK